MSFDCEPMHPGEDGWSEWIHPLPGYLMQCCDCRLVHEMEAAIVAAKPDEALFNAGEGEDGVVVFRMRRAEQQANVPATPANLTAPLPRPEGPF